jgi:glutaredoxin
MNKVLIMYSRRMGCPYVTLAKRVLDDYTIAYREIYIDQDEEARARVLTWTGFLSVPTLVVSSNGDDLPYELPQPLPKGSSPRGINRGTIITEPGADQLKFWLAQHGFIEMDET